MKFTRDMTQEESGCKELIFSIFSNEPYRRYDKKLGDFDEVLNISNDSIDWTRLNSGACPFLLDHDIEHQIGVIEKAWIEGNKVKAKVKFSDSQEVQQIVKDIQNGIRTNTSIGYNIDDYHIEQNGNLKTLIADKFMVYESSLVACPADPTVGYNRSLKIEDNDMNQQEEEKLENTEETENKKAIEESEDKPNDEDKNDSENVDGADNPTNENSDDQHSERAADATDSEPEKDTVETEQEEEENKEELEEIRSLGELTGFRDLAKKFVEEKRSYDEFKKAIKNNNNKKELNVKGNNNMKKFNLVKALRMNTSKFNGNVEDTDEYKIIQENKRNFNVNDADIVVTRKQLRAFPDGSETLNQTVYRPDLYTENLRPDSIIAKTRMQNC